MSRAVVVSLVVLVICDYVKPESDSDCCEGCQRSYIRVKRGKFYAGPPQRYYSRPPTGFRVKGPYSYTPPPPFMADNGPNYPGIKPYKVSKRPSNVGLVDEDINNLVKYLTKKDLDKILEYAYEKEKNYDDLYTKAPHRGYEKPIYKDEVQNSQDAKLSYQDPSVPNELSKYIHYVTELMPDKDHPPKDVQGISNFNIDTAEILHSTQSFLRPNEPERIPRGQNNVNQNDPYSYLSNNVHNRSPENQNYVNNNVHNSISTSKDYSNAIAQESHNSQMYNTPNVQESFYNSQNYMNSSPDVQESSYYSQSYINPSLNVQENYISPSTESQLPEPGNSYFSDSNEEQNLPRPVNMRDEDFEASYTNNVPTVVKTDSTSYKVEDFGNLPLMNYYDSKLHSVSSYHVPHYTVTTLHKQQQPASTYSSSSSSTSLVPSPAAASIRAPPVEPAPPVSAAKEQSDAHLKAIKIWSHRSKGTAYTLHNDGSLSLEIPGRPKYG